MKPVASHPELQAVRQGLQELHRVLLAALKKDHERIAGRVVPPAEWFQILIGSPEYQWVKPLNSLVSDVDALTELPTISETDILIVQYELEFFFFKENDDVTSFNYHYRKIFQHQHDVMFSHGHLRQAFLALPKGHVPVATDKIRSVWHKISASKRKLMN